MSEQNSTQNPDPSVEQTPDPSVERTPDPSVERTPDPSVEQTPAPGQDDRVPESDDLVQYSDSPSTVSGNTIPF